MKKKYLFFLAGLLLMSACGNSTKDAAQRVQTVKIDTVRSASGSGMLQFPGRVKAAEEISLSFKVSGRIQRIFVKEGDYVRAGQLVAAMDPTDYEVQLRATEAEHAQITAEADRVIKLYEENATTANNYDKAVYGKRQIDAKLKNHRDQLSYTKIYAPMSGYIQEKRFNGGENVSAGMPVLTMLSGGMPEVEISLPAADYARRSQFCSYSCTFDVYPGRVYQLRPVSTSPKANANQLYTMRLALQGGAKDETPSPGMNTMVSIQQGEGGSIELCVPTGAVLQKNGQQSVFTFDPQKKTIHKHAVKMVRLLGDGCCLVTSDDVRAGDIVVSSGTHHVKDGEHVEPLKEKSETNVGGLL